MGAPQQVGRVIGRHEGDGAGLGEEVAEFEIVESSAQPSDGLSGLKKRFGCRRYRPQGELGRGPVTTVFRAMHEESGQPVALKLFDARFHQEPRFAIRFRDHLKAVVGLDHIHLVGVRDYGLAGDHFYIITELVDGLNLATFLSESGTLSPGAAAEVARQVCVALAAAHGFGLVHRNLKPQNVLLAEDGQVKVADVGLSGLLSESGLSQTSVMLHGAGFMAPEQARGQTAGPAADVYSLGVILFQMLTGRPPFESRDVWQVVQMRLLADPPSVRDLNPDVSPELAAVVAQALRKESADRFATADDMAAALAPLSSAIDGIKLPPALSRSTSRPRAVRLPAVISRRLAQLDGLAAETGVTDGWQRFPRLGLLLGLQFFISFIVVFLLLLALTGTPAGSLPPQPSGREPPLRMITKPLPATSAPTATTSPTATPTPEPSLTVAPVRQAPSIGEGDSQTDPADGDGPPDDEGPPPWAGGPAQGGGPPEERGDR